MNDKMDDSDEEEEVIVYANFEEGTVEKEVFQIPNVKFKIIGLDSDTPVVQLRDSTFKGEWHDTIGTKLLLEEDLYPEQTDPAFTVTPKVMLKYKCQTTKTLDLSRIFLKPKSNIKAEDSAENCDSPEAKMDAEDQVTETLKDVIESTVEPDAVTDELMQDIVNSAITE